MQPNDKVLINRIPIPEPGEGQYQVKVAAASLCHSDLMMSVRPDSITRPLTIGHEGVGIISKIHPSAEGKGFKIGDRIGMFYVIDCCFDCDGCIAHGTFCTKPRNGGAKIQGLGADGFFAEYAVIDWQNALRLDDALPIERMSPLFCAGITAFHAVDKCELDPGQWIAIIGCGGLGQLATRYAKAMGLKVIGLDVNDRMLDIVKETGADATFNPKSDPKFNRQLPKLTGKRGVHAAAVFSNSHAAYATAQKALAFDGVLMIVGLPETPLQFRAYQISFGMFRVKGASNGTVAEAQKAVDFTAKHKIIPDVVFRNLDEMPQMWDEMNKGTAEKRMVVSFVESKSKI